MSLIGNTINMLTIMTGRKQTEVWLSGTRKQVSRVVRSKEVVVSIHKKGRHARNPSPGGKVSQEGCLGFLEKDAEKARVSVFFFFSKSSRSIK